jgi:hypothetical protein
VARPRAQRELENAARALDRQSVEQLAADEAFVQIARDDLDGVLGECERQDFEHATPRERRAQLAFTDIVHAEIAAWPVPFEQLTDPELVRLANLLAEAAIQRVEELSPDHAADVFCLIARKDRRFSKLSEVLLRADERSQ